MRAALGGHARAAQRIAADGQFNAALFFSERTLHQREIGFLDDALAKVFGDLGVGEIILGDDNGAGSIFVQAMDDTGAEQVGRLR